VFELLAREGRVERDEMFRVFNMGIGMVVIVPPFHLDAAADRLEEHGVTTRVIGEIRAGERRVVLD
jgi:phosphoribosylformylglycinamidine cyclo-ligase